jgi:predicted nucleotidyltransferase
MFILLFIFSFSIETTAQETGDLFLYIPSNEAMSDYFALYSYLRAWDRGEVNTDNERLSAFFRNYVGVDTLQSLLFESFLRYTRNVNIQNQILYYINSNDIYTNFANSLRKLYVAVPITRQSEGKDVIQYSYNNTEFDENINLFLFNEVYTFNNEIGLLLFENDWNMFSYDNSPNPNIDAFFLIFGGGTNAMTITFRRYANITKDEPESIYNAIAYRQRYNEKWKITTLPLEGILSRAGADRITIAQGLGPDEVAAIETGTFNVYLYKEAENIMYEVSYFMNFAPINIHFLERNRIFNFLFFQLLFAFLR